MSREVRIHEINRKDIVFGVRATVDGETIAHTFPLGQGWEKENEDGVPRFVNKLVERRNRIEEKKKQSFGVEKFERRKFEVD